MSEVIERQIRPAIGEISEILAGRPPEIQSIILADLLAIWVGGFVVVGDRKATSEIRAEVLARHIKLVTDLVETGAVEPKGGAN